jgi:hypothetical protein
MSPEWEELPLFDEAVPADVYDNEEPDGEAPLRYDPADTAGPIFHYDADTGELVVWTVE